jgi:hypothetical protein
MLYWDKSGKCSTQQIRNLPIDIGLVKTPTSHIVGRLGDRERILRLGMTGINNFCELVWLAGRNQKAIDARFY